MDEVYKEVLSSVFPPNFGYSAQRPQATHVPYALPTEDRYLVLVRSKQQIEELDRIPEHHVSFHQAMTDVSLKSLTSTLSRLIL